MLFAERATPHEISGMFVVSVWNHGKPCTAERGTILVDADVVRDRLRPSALAAEVNEGADLPCLKEFIGRVVIHGRVKTHIFDRDGRHMLFHFMESYKETNGIMAFGTGKS